MPPLSNLKQEQVIRAFVRMGGVETPRRRGKGSHRMVAFRGQMLTFPEGIVNRYLLLGTLKQVNVSVEEFLEHLK